MQSPTMERNYKHQTRGVTSHIYDVKSDLSGQWSYILTTYMEYSIDLQKMMDWKGERNILA